MCPIPLGLLDLFIGVDALLQQGGHQGDVALHAGIAHGRPASTVIVEGVLESILIPQKHIIKETTNKNPNKTK